jgi:hypothetical protein
MFALFQGLILYIWTTKWRETERRLDLLATSEALRRVEDMIADIKKAQDEIFTRLRLLESRHGVTQEECRECKDSQTARMDQRFDRIIAEIRADRQPRFGMA